MIGVTLVWVQWNCGFARTLIIIRCMIVGVLSGVTFVVLVLLRWTLTIVLHSLVLHSVFRTWVQLVWVVVRTLRLATCFLASVLASSESPWTRCLSVVLLPDSSNRRLTGESVIGLLLLNSCVSGEEVVEFVSFVSFVSFDFDLFGLDRVSGVLVVR